MTEAEKTIHNFRETRLNQIRAWEKELDAMDKENGYNMGRTTLKEDEKKVEHFQNQFIIQKARLDEMKHNIKVYGGETARGGEELKEYGDYLEELRDEFASFCHQFS